MRGIVPPMKRLLLAIAASVLAASPVPAVAGAGSFTVVNATGADFTALSIRRFGSRGEWQSLPAAPRAGAKGVVSFSDNDCAFDLQASWQAALPHLVGREPVRGECDNLTETTRAQSGSTTIKRRCAMPRWGH